MTESASNLASTESFVGGMARNETRLTFAEAYEAYFDFVFRTAKRLGVPDASIDDVVQEVFLVVHRRFDDYDGHASTKSWIYGVLSHVVRSHRRRYLRKESRLSSLDVAASDTEALRSTAPQPLELVERREAGATLLRILASLDDDKREVLVLAELEQMPMSQISEALGVNANTLYSRLKAAKKAVAGAYAREKARNRSR